MMCLFSLDIESFEFWLEQIALDRVHIHHVSKLDLSDFGTVFDFDYALHSLVALGPRISQLALANRINSLTGPHQVGRDRR